MSIFYRLKFLFLKSKIISFVTILICFTLTTFSVTISDIQSNGVNIEINCPSGYTEGTYLINSASGGGVQYNITL